MSRKFIATVVAAALAVTAFGNAPARADDDLARALAAFVGVAIVGKIISDKFDDDESNRSRRSVEIHHNPGHNHATSDQVVRRVKPRSVPRRAKRHLLPGDCLRSFKTKDGRYRVFGKKCLKKNYKHARSLPTTCEVKFRTKRKKRSGYDARCLHREGYQLARR